MANKKQKVAPAAALTNLQAVDQQAQEALNQALKGYDEVIAAGKANLDAVIEANTAAYDGAKQLSEAFVTYVQAAHEANVAASKAVTAAKTLQEAVELQQGHVQSSLQGAIAKGNELSEVAVAVANQVIEPLQARSKIAVEKLFTPIAA